MAYYYDGQTLTLSLDTNDDSIDSASLKQIRVKDPEGTITNHTATASGTSLEATISASSLNINGYWSAQAYAEFSGGIVKIGDTVKFLVKDVYK